MRGEEGRKLIRLILESLFWGLSGVEFKVGREFALEEIPRKHIKIEQGVIAKNQYNAYDDEFKIDELPFVWVIGEKNHLGLLLTCSLYAVYKRGNWGDWAQYVEIFGQPVRIVEYDAYDTKTKEEIRKLGRESGNGLFMMIPKQAKFSMLDGKQSNGNGDLQDKFKNACNEEMAICILGNTETTSSSRSSGYAQSKEHAEQQDEITASDLVFIENTLNSARFLKILSSYGYPVEGGKFKYNIELNLEKLKKRLEIDLQVSEKVPFDPDYWYETYGIPKPQNPKLHTDREESKEEKKEKETHVLKEKIRELTDFQPLSFKDRVFKKVADFFDHALQK
ncbi:MAG: DUF935 family protein [Bergeyella sp.]|nr:DUF935 family protein [Bergeyella sp.]